MIEAIRTWAIARQIALLIAAALLLLSAGNMIVTFAGPPPHVPPLRLDEVPGLLDGRGRLPPDLHLAADGLVDTFEPRSDEMRRPPAEAALAVILKRPSGAVRVATSEPLHFGPGPSRTPNHLEGDFSIGIQQKSGVWRVLRSAPRPIFTAWHRMTLVTTLVLTLVLALIASGITRGIVRPIRRLAQEADRAWLDDMRSPITVAGPHEVAHLARTIAVMRDRFAGLVENRTMMLAAIAHDMASPLTRLEFHVAKLPDARRSQAEADLGELSAMISSILDFAKGAQGLDATPVDLAALARDVISRRSTGDAPLSAGAMPQTAWVLGDRLALRRVIDNLAANAQRYAAGGVIEIEVEPRQVKLSVLDEGPGFDPGLSERLFEPFFRVEASRNRETAGAGLGLATARLLAEAHGGTLSAHNRAVGGAIFTLRLPRHEAPRPQG